MDYADSMDIISIAQERLSGPDWTDFLAALDIVQRDRVAGEEAFWHAVDMATAHLFDGIADEDADQIEAAVNAELVRRNLITPAGELVSS